MKGSPKILVIQTAFLGDVILSLPMVQTLKKSMPVCSVDYLCIPQTSKVLQNNPYLDKVVIYDKHNTGLKEFIRIITHIKNESYDVVLCPHRSYRSAVITNLSRAKIRIGFDLNPFAFLLTGQAVYDEHQHEVMRNLELIREIPGIQVAENEADLKPELFPSEKDRELAEKLLKFINGNQRVAAFAPCSKWFTKQIPVTKARELVYHVMGLGFKVVLIGGTEDTEYCRTLKEEIPDEGLVNFCGRLTPLQSYVLISKSAILITTDSAAMHLGGAAGTPIAAIYGSTIPGFGFYPLTSRHKVIEVEGLECRPCTDHGRKKCPLEHFKCMEEIKGTEVAEAVRQLIIDR